MPICDNTLECVVICWNGHHLTAAADEETLDLVLEDHDTDYEIPDSKNRRR